MAEKEIPPLLAQFIKRLNQDSVQYQGDLQYKARCPSHDDDHASLSVAWGEKKGTVVVTCHANCTYSEILESLGLTKRDMETQRTVDARYDYEDEDGVLRYQVTKWKPKAFTQRRPGRRKGEWINNMEGVEPIPYRLPAVAELVAHGTEDDDLWIPEGEKDVQALETAYSVVATTNSGGATKWTDAHSAYLVGFKGNVIIVIDNDDKATKPGQKHALAVYESILRVADIESELVYPVEGKDAADVVGKYGMDDGFEAVTPEMLRAEIEGAAANGVEGVEEVDEVLRAIRLLFHAEDENRLDVYQSLKSDADVLALAPPQYVIENWLPVGFFSDLFGAPGSKKTFVILDMLRCIASGKRWQGYTVKQGATILFEGEGLDQLQGRIIAWNEGYEVHSPIPARWTDASINLTSPEGVATVVRTVHRFQDEIGMPVVAIGFDPIVEYMVGNEVDGGNELVTRGLRALAQHLGIAVVAGVHTNAAGERARGSDHLRMRSGAHIKVETLPEGYVGLLQDKLKNDVERAVVLAPLNVGPSLVLDKIDDTTAAEYVARRLEQEAEGRRRGKERVKEASVESQTEKADEMLLLAVASTPGLSRGRVLSACIAKGVGKPLLEQRLDALSVDGGPIRIERQGAAKNAPVYHYLATEKGR